MTLSALYACDGLVNDHRDWNRHPRPIIAAGSLVRLCRACIAVQDKTLWSVDNCTACLDSFANSRSVWCFTKADWTTKAVSSQNWPGATMLGILYNTPCPQFETAFTIPGRSEGKHGMRVDGLESGGF